VPTVARKKLATGLLNKMAEAWGYMLFHTDLFHSVREMRIVLSGASEWRIKPEMVL
jgi:hypothetical protein